MSTELIVDGPYEIPCNKTGITKYIETKVHVKQFWEKVKTDIKEKNGCYVFAMKAGKGYSPWWIGKTNKSLQKECFDSHKIPIYIMISCKKVIKAHL